MFLLICSKGPKNEFETAVVNEPSVLEPLKFHCNSFLSGLMFLLVLSVGVIILVRVGNLVSAKTGQNKTRVG